jgi:hypothetical protein
MAFKIFGQKGQLEDDLRKGRQYFRNSTVVKMIDRKGRLTACAVLKNFEFQRLRTYDFIP